MCAVLVFNGRVLREGARTEDYGMTEGSTVFYTRRKPAAHKEWTCIPTSGEELSPALMALLRSRRAFQAVS